MADQTVVFVVRRIRIHRLEKFNAYCSTINLFYFGFMYTLYVFFHGIFIGVGPALV